MNSLIAFAMDFAARSTARPKPKTVHLRRTAHVQPKIFIRNWDASGNF